MEHVIANLAASLPIPPGRWAVGVSGGADSVALTAILGERASESILVVHVDHETRGGESAADANFVRALCERWNIPCLIRQRSEVEGELPNLPANRSARFRLVRLAAFAEAVSAHQLDGVMLAHHADDQAETILLRLLRGSGAMGLAGMRHRTRVRGLVVVRPLLSVRRATIREVLQQAAIPWREDSSNTSAAYLRNRVRQVLEADPRLFEPVMALGAAAGRLRSWANQAAPRLGARFAAGELADLPGVIARVAAARWLAAAGCPPAELDPSVLARLIRMSDDASTAARQQFPGAITVRRQRGNIRAEPLDPFMP